VNQVLSVLVVDENVKMRSMITEIIKIKTKNVIECTKGIDALEEYKVHNPNWIVIDAKMKRMDGLTATELVHQYFPSAKVMVVSQDDTPEMRQAAHHAGATVFVPKENLLEILDTLNQERV
jgi:two-component system, chemotaxis family, chemotaxis protein CheY